MKLRTLINFTLISLLVVLIAACSPTKEDTGTLALSASSASWIPFNGTENVIFVSDTLEMEFSGQGKLSVFESTRYSSDQSGFFSIQKDLYVDLEKQTLQFNSEETPYLINYYLQKYKGEAGTWDILRVSVADDQFYKNEIKIVVFETDKFDKGEVYDYSAKMNLGGTVYDSVYSHKQESRPFELYYTKKYGIVGFKLSANELWTLKQPE